MLVECYLDQGRKETARPWSRTVANNSSRWSYYQSRFPPSGIRASGSVCVCVCVVVLVDDEEKYRANVDALTILRETLRATGIVRISWHRVVGTSSGYRGIV